MTESAPAWAGARTVKVPEGIDPGFEYAPGSTRLRTAIPPERLVAIDRATARDIDLPGDLPRDMTGP